MMLKFRIQLMLYRIFEPYFTRLKKSVQKELDRLARMAVIADGIRRWVRFKKHHGNYDFNATYHPSWSNLTWEEKIKRRQSLCDHLKAHSGLRGSVEDFNVIYHRFIDASMMIKCAKCRKEWWHTNKFTDPEWDKAFKMVKHSTNAPSSSEVPLTQLKEDEPNGPDNLSQRMP